MAKRRTEPGNLLRVAIYLRVSSDEQVKNHYSLDTQLEYCSAKLDRDVGPNLYVARVFRDGGVKGQWGLYDPYNPRRKYRRGLTEMYDAFKAGELDAICVYRLNRLWRRAATAEFLTEHFIPNGLTRVLSCTENVDMSTASGRFHLNISAAAGAYEAEQLGEWISHARQQRLKEGYALRAPFGWRRQTDDEKTGRRRNITVVPEQAAIVREAAERFVAGESLRSIARSFNARGIPSPGGAAQWDTGSVRQMLRVATHAGLLILTEEDGTKIETDGKHYPERINDKAVYYQIIERLERNRTQGSRVVNKPEFLLGGLLRCGHCGEVLNTRFRRGSMDRLYRCSSGSQMGNAECTSNTEHADSVEKVVIEELRRIASVPDVLEAAEANVRAVLAHEQAATEKEIGQLEARLKKVWDSYAFWSGERDEGRCEPDEFQMHLTKFRKAKEEVEAHLQPLRDRQHAEGAHQALLYRAQQLVKDFDASWEGLPQEQKRELIQQLVAQASITRLSDGTTEMTFTIKGFSSVTRRIGRRLKRGRPPSGYDSLTPRLKAMLYLQSKNPDRDAIARQTGVRRATVDMFLAKACRQMGVKQPGQAWEMIREYVEDEVDLLPLKGCRRKVKPKTREGPLLTPAQIELLSAIREGMTALAAGERLGMSGSTVYVHLKNCRDRLGAASNEEAVRKAQALGYVGKP